MDVESAFVDFRNCGETMYYDKWDMNVGVLGCEHEIFTRSSFYRCYLVEKIQGTPYNGTKYSCLTVSQVVAIFNQKRSKWGWHFRKWGENPTINK